MVERCLGHRSRQETGGGSYSLCEPKFASEGKDAHGLDVTPDGTQLWITTQTTDEITIASTKDNSIIDHIRVGRDPNWIRFTPDGKLAVVSNMGSNDVNIIDVMQRKVVSRVNVGASPKRLAVGSVSIR